MGIYSLIKNLIGGPGTLFPARDPAVIDLPVGFRFSGGKLFLIMSISDREIECEDEEDLITKASAYSRNPEINGKRKFADD